MLGFNWAFDWIERERDTHREEKRCRAPTGSWTLCHWPFFPPSFPSARARRACAWPCTRMKEPTDRPDIDVVSSRAAREKSSTKHSVPRDYLSGPAKAAGKMRRLILSQEPPLLTRRRSRVNCLFSSRRLLRLDIRFRPQLANGQKMGKSKRSVSTTGSHHSNPPSSSSDSAIGKVAGNR